MKDDRTVSTVPAAPITCLSPMSLRVIRKDIAISAFSPAIDNILRSAGPALCCYAIMACCERLRSRRKGSARSEHVGRDFRPNHTEQRAIAGPQAFNGLCDDEGVPLICPTCQVFAQRASVPATAATLHGVVFDIFGGPDHRTAAQKRTFTRTVSRSGVNGAPRPMKMGTILFAMAL